MQENNVDFEGDREVRDRKDVSGNGKGGGDDNIEVITESIFVSKDGPRLYWCDKTKWAQIQFPTGEHDPLDVPCHPDGDEQTQLLSDYHAWLCTEDMELEDEADRSKIYVKKGIVCGEEEEFVRAVYFTADTADRAMKDHGHVGGRLAAGDGILANMAELSDRFKAYCKKNKKEAAYPAKGAYVALGIGNMAGRNRSSVMFPQTGGATKNQRSNVPFDLKTWPFAMETEEVLGNVMATASMVARLGMPQEMWEKVRMQEFMQNTGEFEDQRNAEAALPTAAYLTTQKNWRDLQRLNRAYQFPCAPVYPRTYNHDLMVASHQVVLRGPMPDEEGETEEDREEKCANAATNLHVDTGDGGISGSLYSCHQTDDEIVPEDVVTALRWRDLVVFPGIHRFQGKGLQRGGRGVRISVLRPGWFCWVFFKTMDCLHGGVTQDSEEIHCQNSRTIFNPVYRVSMQLPGLDCMRCITYKIKAILTMIDRLSASRAARSFVLPKLEEMSSSIMQHRIHGRRGPRAIEIIDVERIVQLVWSVLTQEAQVSSFF